MPWLTGAISVLWIVGLVNSFNMLDNMDGLSAGVAAIAAAMLAAVMLLVARSDNTRQPQLFVAGFLLVLVGSLVGFLWHNRPPARLFMGDAGSYFIGYLLAMATLTGHLRRRRPAAARDPRPLVRAGRAAVRHGHAWSGSACGSGRSPFVGDKNHFSHRLVELGLTQDAGRADDLSGHGHLRPRRLLLHQVNQTGAP